MLTTKDKILNVVFLLINLLTAILIFTLGDYLVHIMENAWSVPPHYFWNKVPAGLLLAVIGTLIATKIKNIWLKALIVGIFTATLLQGRYFIEGYALDFVIIFLFIHFAILYFPLVIVFSAYNKYKK